MDIAGTNCALARESVSADLDGELSELDRHRLQAHLRVCGDCSAWADQVRTTTTQLRETPVEVPAPAAFEMPRLSRTWHVGPGLAVGSATALVAAVVVALGAAHGSLGKQVTTDNHPTTPAKQQVAPTVPAVDDQTPAWRHGVVHAI